MSDAKEMCPILTAGAMAGGHIENEGSCVCCRKSGCAFWTSINTIEGLSWDGCAIKLLVGQNSDGRMNV